MLEFKTEAMRGPGSIPIRGNFFSKFYNPNLHNIARSDRIGFKTKNPNRSTTNFKLLNSGQTSLSKETTFRNDLECLHLKVTLTE